MKNKNFQEHQYLAGARWFSEEKLFKFSNAAEYREALK